MTAATIQDAIDRIIAASGVTPPPGTVDTVKTGDPAQPLAGIVTTFLATSDVIRRAVDLGANLIVTHEPTFYTHMDTTDWLRDDPVYRAKRELIDAHGIVIWRFHDIWHRTRPDGIAAGMARQLGWELDTGQVPDRQDVDALFTGAGWDTELAGRLSPVATIAPTPLAALAGQLADTLGAAAVRVAGRDDMICRRVGMTLGALPGSIAIAMLRRDDVDVLLCGEVHEWEACEYLRDAADIGRRKGMIVVGHAASEDGGMAYLAEWLRPHLPGVGITHVACGDPLRAI